MKFDQFDADLESSEQLLPDGQHECEIVKAKRWISQDQSRTALIVTLRPVSEGYLEVEKWLDPSRKEDHKSAMQLADALGISRDDGLGDNLLGGRVVIAARRGTSKKTGEPVVYVNGFTPSATPGFAAPAPESAVEAKPAAKRTQAAKAHGQITEGNPDAVPF